MSDLCPERSYAQSLSNLGHQFLQGYNSATAGNGGVPMPNYGDEKTIQEKYALGEKHWKPEQELYIDTNLLTPETREGILAGCDPYKDCPGDTSEGSLGVSATTSA